MIKLSVQKITAKCVFFAISATLSACGNSEPPPPVPSKNLGKEYKVDIFNNKNFFVGKITFTQASHGVLLDIVADGLTPGKHGMHFHEIGHCDHKDSFKKAGEHIMPSGLPHGFLNPQGPHEGNLPNLIVDATGSVRVELYTDAVNLFPEENGKPALSDHNGSALIIHEKADDHFTQPIGNSGDRVACALIKATEEPKLKE